MSDSSAAPGKLTDSNNLPQHVAIIMDGNGRWAQKRRKMRSAGHRAGARSVRSIIEETHRKGIKYLTVFAFSSENWNRPADEVSTLMELFLRALRREVNELNANGVRLRFLGDRSGFANALCDEMQKAEVLTEANDKLNAFIAVGYGGRWDISQATRQVAEAVQRGELQPEEINEATVGQYLSLAGVPEPDLLIRTGGEQRISNFLLWQMAYTELYFCDTLWPDFDVAQYNEALHWFAGRERRFGEVPAVDSVAPAGALSRTSEKR